MSQITFEHENGGFLADGEREAFCTEMEKVVLLIEYSYGKESTILGTGFALQRRGYVLTAFHVRPDKVKSKVLTIDVRLKNTNRLYAAQEVARDEKKDLLLLKIKESGKGKLREDEVWNYVKLSTSIIIGSESIIISQSGGMYYSCSFGQIASPCRKLDNIRQKRDKGLQNLDKNMEVIQINNTHGVCGMSGSPVFNSKGEVLGMISFILSQYDFAISTAYFQVFLSKHMK